MIDGADHFSDQLTTGEYLADYLAKKFASWYFASGMLLFSASYISWNIFSSWRFDARFERFNLVVSIFTLFIDLCIIMNQLRQAMLDRTQMNRLIILEQQILGMEEKHTDMLETLIARDRNEAHL